METFSVGYGLLAMQSALLDAVTPELRAVDVDIVKDKYLLYTRFYYDGEVSEKLIDLWDCAITEASADLGVDCRVDGGIERFDYPKKIPIHGRLAYLRKEDENPILENFFKVGASNESEFSSLRKIENFHQIIGGFIHPVTEANMETNWGISVHVKNQEFLIPAKPVEMEIEIFPVAYALLGMQRALLGAISPELRAVLVDVDNEKKQLYLRFYFSGEISNEVRVLWEIAITKVYADMGIDYILDAKIERLDYPEKIPVRGRYAYLRKEDVLSP